MAVIVRNIDIRTGCRRSHAQCPQVSRYYGPLGKVPLVIANVVANVVP